MKHKTVEYLLNPTHPITITLVGCGGNGSNVLSGLGKIHLALVSLGHPGLMVTVFDPDTISEANLGRQLFVRAELGLNKAEAMVRRINRFFGTTWIAKPDKFGRISQHIHPSSCNILISCVDTASARIEIGKIVTNWAKNGDQAEFKTPYYWIDMGNGKTYGQVVLGTIVKRMTYNLPNVIEQFPSLAKIKEKDEGPSCSLAIALSKQDLFINPILSNFALDILWKLLHEGGIDYRGVYVNLKTFQVRPIPIETVYERSEIRVGVPGSKEPSDLPA